MRRKGRIAVIFLARGYEHDHAQRFERFINSYARNAAGAEHNLHVILKGFRDPAHEDFARNIFSRIAHTIHNTDDFSFDIGAYSDILPILTEDFVCFFNSHAEIQSEYWLKKLIDNLNCAAVGMVGATGSYESLNFIDPDFPRFPNPHLRTNGFALRLSDARQFFPRYGLRDKLEAWKFESGADGLTNRFASRGLISLVVGRDGCGYGPDEWGTSETYRQGVQSNLLIDDNVTRVFPLLSLTERKMVIKRTWGFVSPAILIDTNTMHI